MEQSPVTRLSPAYERGWPDRENGPFLLRLHVALADGRPFVAGFEITNPGLEDYTQDWPAPRPIVTETVRVPVKKLLREALVAMDKGIAQAEDSDERTLWNLPHARTNRAAIASGARGKLPAGRPPLYGDEHYREVAEVYLKAANSLGSPTQAVLEHFRNISTYDVAAKHVTKAADKGYLTKGKKGKFRERPKEDA